MTPRQPIMSLSITNLRRPPPSADTMPPRPRRATPAAAPVADHPRTPLPLRPVAPRINPIGRPDLPGTVPFADAAQAWFWTLGALASRRDGSGRGGRGIPRPCDPDDVIRALDLLHRRGGIGLHHARVLRRWGERGVVPTPAFASQRDDAVLWTEALERLEGLLRAKGIVGREVS